MLRRGGRRRRRARASDDDDGWRVGDGAVRVRGGTAVRVASRRDGRRERVRGVQTERFEQYVRVGDVRVRGRRESGRDGDHTRNVVLGSHRRVRIA
mgnify:CR=1 FL=1